MKEPQQHAVLVVALAVAAIAGVLDWRRGQIPNWLTYGALVLSPLAHTARLLATKAPLETAMFEGAGYSVVGAILTALVPIILYRQGAIGGGDVKICAALGAMLHTVLGVEAEMYGFFAATLVAPAQLAYHGKLLSALRNALTILANLFRPKSRQESVDESTMSWFRLGPALFFGVALTAYLHW